MTIRLIGIDCATEDAKVGLARGLIDGAVTRIDEVVVCGKQRSAADHVASWLGTSDPVLLALDAPLGWPQPLSSCLTNHRAGDEVLVAPNDMFRRATDRFIQYHLGKTPLDVGADRIARTAHAALQLLGELRRRLGQPIPLAWSPQLSAGVSAIEVYPAATLGVWGIRSTRYKKPDQVDERKEIITALRRELVLPLDVTPLEQNADGLDAAVCVLCARDFLLGQASPPENPSLAVVEGWIWTRTRAHLARGEA
jgi:predicted RNase H-like nuclease